MSWLGNKPQKGEYFYDYDSRSYKVVVNGSSKVSRDTKRANKIHCKLVHPYYSPNHQILTANTSWDSIHQEEWICVFSVFLSFVWKGFLLWAQLEF